jgi:hypothetical protein
MCGDSWGRAGLTIVALSLFAQSGEESLAVAMSITAALHRRQDHRTSHAVRGVTLAYVACSLSGLRGASRRCPRRGSGQAEQHVPQSPL